MAREKVLVRRTGHARARVRVHHWGLTRCSVLARVRRALVDVSRAVVARPARGAAALVCIDAHHAEVVGTKPSILARG